MGDVPGQLKCFCGCSESVDCSVSVLRCKDACISISNSVLFRMRNDWCILFLFSNSLGSCQITD